MFFADFLGGDKYSFLKHQYKQMKPELLQSRPRFCAFYMVYAAFHLFKFRQEESTGVQVFNVLSFLSNYM